MRNASPFHPSPGGSNLRRSPAYAFLFCVAGTVVLIDQIVKALVTGHLSDGRSVKLLGGAVRLISTTNTGAAFSLFTSGGIMFMVVAAAVAAGIIWYYEHLSNGKLTMRVALALILGGALGNLADRVRLGHVVDFIDLGWWPVFNLADSAVVLGASLLVLMSFLSGRVDSVT